MFSGNFNTVDLAEVVQLLSASAQSGVLLVRQGNRDSAVGLQLGQLVDARSGEAIGLDALALIASSLEGEFTFQVGAVSAGQTLAAYPTDQLIEGLRREIADQRAHLDAMPEADSVIRYISGGASAGLHATPEELGLLLLADGRRTVRDIAATAGKPLAEAQWVLARFRIAGLLEDVARQGPPPPPPPPPGDQPQFWRGRRIG